MATYVWIVEEQNGETGDLGYVSGVYSTEELANAAAEEIRSEWRADGLTVYEDADENQDDWDRSAVVNKWEVDRVCDAAS